MNIVPDIFYTTDITRAYEEELIRTIPRTMIENYAPRYAELLYSTDIGWKLNKSINNEYYGLCLYDDYYDKLNAYSIYRLDWLEKLGIQPQGYPVKVEERVFFTDIPFSKNDFTSIIQMFTRDDAFLKKAVLETEITRGMEMIINGMSFFDSLSILNIWRVNNTIMENNGEPIPFYANEKYREFLIYIANIGVKDVFSVTLGPSMSRKEDSLKSLAGMWNDDIYHLFFNISLLLNRNPDAHLLITPPETETQSTIGASASKFSQPYSASGAWVVSAHVTDEKLARILELFDGISCDRETFVATAFGIEGDNYIWADEPYNSRIIELNEYTAVKDGVRVFSTNVIDERAAKLDYWLGSNILKEYASNTDVRDSILWPYKEDLLGVYASEKAALDDLFDEKINHIVTEYFREAARGRNDVISTWDYYIAELYQNGLQEYIDLYKKYPD